MKIRQITITTNNSGVLLSKNKGKKSGMALCNFRAEIRKTNTIITAKRKRIFFFLPSILEQSLEKEDILEHRAVLADMLTLLLRKGLIMFGGVEPVIEFFNLPDFYQYTPIGYSWPVIPVSLDINYDFEVKR